jgi:hypothetical protein
MSCHGDPVTRPVESFVTVASRDMDRELAHLTSSAVLVLLEWDRPKVRVDVMVEAFCTEFSVLPKNLSVAKHYPEDFIVVFKHRHDLDATVDRRNFNLGNLDIRVRHVGLDHVDMKFHARCHRRPQKLQLGQP